MNNTNGMVINGVFPLTLQEMNGLIREPVYLLHKDTILNSSLPWAMNGWHILEASSYSNHGVCDWFVDNDNSKILSGNYGITWVAYYQNPFSVRITSTNNISKDIQNRC